MTKRYDRLFFQASYPCRQFDGHFEDFFGHKIFNVRGKAIGFSNRQQVLSREGILVFFGFPFHS
jgi:hypothetical protein